MAGAERTGGAAMRGAARRGVAAICGALRVAVAERGGAGAWRTAGVERTLALRAA